MPSIAVQPSGGFFQHRLSAIAKLPTWPESYSQFSPIAVSVTLRHLPEACQLLRTEQQHRACMSEQMPQHKLLCPAVRIEMPPSVRHVPAVVVLAPRREARPQPRPARKPHLSCVPYLMVQFRPRDNRNLVSV